MEIIKRCAIFYTCFVLPTHYPEKIDELGFFIFIEKV